MSPLLLGCLVGLGILGVIGLGYGLYCVWPFAIGSFVGQGHADSREIEL